jgi:DUF4097 and DUF4098 domain-containing protein YvlB
MEFQMRRSCRLAALTALILAACTAVSAQIKHEVFVYNVKPRPVISIRNQYGRITVTPSPDARVVATIVHSDAVEIQGEQNGNRIEFATGSQLSSGVKADNVDYKVFVPADACVILSTAAGSLSAENLEGDLVFEGITASVDAHSLRNAHVHVKTLSGPIFLRQVVGGRVDVRTSSGDVTLQDVSGPMVEVHSGTGQIKYFGNPGVGTYRLVTTSGNIHVSMPVAILARVKAKSIKGKVDNPIEPQPQPPIGFSFRPKTPASHKAAAAFELLSFQGDISVREASK